VRSGAENAQGAGLTTKISDLRRVLPRVASQKRLSGSIWEALTGNAWDVDGPRRRL
jgi:hypothetical protein